ncbi:hypothetical protein J2Z44_002720 [Clostridium punense]|uniref:ABC transporter permease n=1 Tax=Clostridium punense TaxID=1054297 RepID=A0ABS4K545_9CLOT|nr:MULTISPECIES: hypothetical protein [Clostridium]EQB86121.1 hypothetical protein M918_15510 [Clostridium sp. BL8]MBP2022895.1 hypothetical protein [Clostridium punense]
MTDFKNGTVFNTSCTIVYIIVSYVFTLWYNFEFIIFDIEVTSATKFFISYIIFMALVLWLLKISNSKIVSAIIGVLSLIYLKGYVQEPINSFINNKIGNSLQIQSLLSFDFLAQIAFIILNLVILFFAILRIHEQMQNKEIN